MGSEVRKETKRSHINKEKSISKALSVFSHIQLAFAYIAKLATVCTWTACVIR